jgi:peptidoglycan/xylan/chitin deacetylase (PgdA/CDA1 family)
MISFDDGRDDALRFADPLLKQAGMRATMFVITSRASDPGLYYAPWSRLESASRSGRWDLESHTAAAHHEQQVADGRSLPALTSLAPGENVTAYRARVRADLARASAAIAAHTGRRPVAFAYPFGAFGADRTNAPAIRAVLRQEVTRRYTLAFHQQDQQTIPLVTGEQPRAGLRRLEVGDWPALKLLARIASAVPPPSPTVTPVGPPPADAPVADAPLAEPGPAPAPPAAVVSSQAAPSPTAGPKARAPRLTGSPPTPTSGSTGGWTRPLLPAPSASSSSPSPPRTTPPTTAKPRTSTPTTKSPVTTAAPPPTTAPPTTAAPTNCGGQPHGKPCSH